jgi:hypothetical protein
MQQNKPNNLFLMAKRSMVKSSIVMACGAVILTGCQLMNANNNKFSRLGESITVQDRQQVIAYAVQAWAQSLTNGYVLWDDKKTRANHIDLAEEPATLFMLRNATNAIGYWGTSKCLSNANSAYWAEVIIRITPTIGSNRLSVAIHGRQFVHGLSLNLHNYTIDKIKSIDLPACSADEQQVLEAIVTELKKYRPKNQS